jgi:amino acid adenylation domain-containing protein
MGVRVRAEGASVRCSAPQGVLTPALQEEIACRKTEILTLLRDDGAGQTLERVRLMPMPREGELPLSFAQQRLWFLDQLEPGTSAYTIVVRRRYRGPLDLTALADAFTELVRRHESLRTTFPSADGEPVQRIADPGPVTFRIVELEHEPAAARDARVEQVVREEAERPFDLARGPLFRPTLLRLNPDEHDLLVAVHHIVADGWSLGILASELGVLYEAFLAGRPSPLPKLPIQYADFALWQRQWLTGDVLAAQRHYWRERLGGRPAPLQLPADNPRSSRPSPAGASHDFVLPHPLAHGLRELSRREGVTLFMTLLAAFKVLLARYCGEEDIVVGTAVANRNRVELEPVIGLFVNTLALRTDLTGDLTFRELLARVRETCLGAYAHPDMPFEKLVEVLQPARTLDQNPLFQVSFVLQGAATGADLAFVTVASPFDLTLFVRDGTDGTLSATIEYKRDLFEPGTIARLAGHYRMLLEGVDSDPDRRISALPLLGEAETYRLLIECNATTTPYPRDRSVHGLFEDQVDATPDAVALVFEGASLTYRELDCRANCLAHHLRALGVVPERLVGVWMDRSMEMILALLGVLKAGGAYVPFDLLAPPERIAFMLSDAKIDILITQERMLARLPALGARAICLDTDGGAIARQPDTRLGGAAGADGLAYVMYTSGSTGEPKGVAATHRSIVRLVKGTDYVRFGPDEVFLQLAASSFDASTFEIWGALLNGGRLAIAPPGVLSVEEMGAVLARHGVTTLWLTAGLFHQVVDHRVGILHPLRQLLAGGDVLSPPHVRRVLTALPGLRLINGYGPTEGTTFTCCHTVTNALPPERSVPIGRPIANTRVYVLDRHLHPVPIGVPGELWIAGDGLARGYVGRPELTAARFVVQRLSPTLEERLYRTGDLVRWLGDGTLEFLGRLDDQVKVRGFRVELGEIEVTLARHPRVRESVVVVRRAPDGESRLVAYVVGDGHVESRDLREFLGRKLPEYMVPTAFVVVDRLPLSASGKVDRRALPESDGRAELVQTPVEPRDELERQLVGIWQDILSVSPVGTRDSFFDLGGHSLLAVRMFARLEKKLGATLPLATLFKAPTIEGLAALIRKGTRPASTRSMVAIQPAGGRPPVFGMPGVGGTVLNYNSLARFLGLDQPFYGMQSRGLDGSEEPLTRIEDIAAEFLREIRELQPDGPYYLVGMCMGGVVAYEMAHQLRAVGQQIGLLALLETWAPAMSSARRRQRGARMPAVFGFVAGRLRLSVETLARLRGRERLRYLLGGVRLFKDIVLQRDLFPGARGELYLQAVTRANLLAFQQYEPRVYPGPVVLFRAEGRKVAPAADYRLAWRDLVTGGLQVYSAPGDDSGLMLQEPHVRVLAAHLKMCIERARTSESPPRRA